MKNIYAYIRISDPKQGKGVSLIEQKDAIERYAAKHNLHISKWFEEQETAAKRGRPVFNQVTEALRQRKAEGLIMHKIDRSARNLRDWADINDLIDAKVEIHFAHESLDMNSRGGRLTADIQAVIAADYIRNLRQESIKGIYGRLKQGLWPFRAPIGYLDTGGGNIKSIDPVKAPKVRKLFELYATGEYSYPMLVDIAEDIGLSNWNDSKISVAGISKILKNSFYIGMMNVKGKQYKGAHVALIKPSLFKKVQDLVYGKNIKKTRLHNYLYRRRIKCESCSRFLIGEKQKGNVYYRCHTKGCKTKSLREDQIQNCIINALETTEINEYELKTLSGYINQYRADKRKKEESILKALKMNYGQLESKLERLTDAYIDTLIDKETYESRRNKIELQKAICEEKIDEVSTQQGKFLAQLEKMLELAKSLANQYILADSERKRKFLEIVTSNFSVSGKTLMISMRSPFSELRNRSSFYNGDLKRGITRTFKPIAFSNENTISIKQKPLTEVQLKNLFNNLMKRVESLELLNDMENI